MTDSEWSSVLSRGRGSRGTSRCCFGAGVISGPGCRGGGSLRGSGGAGGGCKILGNGVKVDVQICFQVCSEDCDEGKFQVYFEDCVKGCLEDSVKVIGEVRRRVEIVVKDGQC